ncbi:unnamed protein product, partial [Symbiodinium sp. KB8]
TLDSRCTEHEQAAIKFPLALELTADFAGKRENYTELLRLLTEETGSKWRIVDEKPKTSGKLMKVSSFAEIPVLIRHMRVTKCRKHVNDENLQKVTSHLAYYLISLPLEDTLEEYEPGQSVVLLLIRNLEQLKSKDLETLCPWLTGLLDTISAYAP